MSTTTYIIAAMIAPIILIGALVVFAFINAWMKNHKYAQSHVQLCSISDSIGTKYYQAEQAADGTVLVIDKNKGKKPIGNILDMHSHPGHYPPKGFTFLQADIPEYYIAGDSFVPLSLKETDPLEVFSHLLRVLQERVTEMVVKVSREEAEKERKSQASLEGLKIVPLLQIVNTVLIVVVGVVIYLSMRGIVSNQNTILDGLRNLGVIP